MQHGEFFAVVISGFPSDLDWSDGYPQVADSLLIEARSKFYLISGDRLQDAVRRFEQPADNLDGLFKDDDLILQWPLQSGQKFGDSGGLARADNMYCWFVSSVAPASMPAASGITAAKWPEYTLEFRTNPDDTEFSFVPDMGITKYSYHHHGTVADTELQLKEFHHAADNSK